MTATQRPTSVPTVKCEICLTEIPASEAHCAEAEDYVLHFCGLDCYREWAARAAEKEQVPDAGKRTE
jgi:hypothetical protein